MVLLRRPVTIERRRHLFGNAQTGKIARFGDAQRPWCVINCSAHCCGYIREDLEKLARRTAIVAGHLRVVNI